MNVSGHRGDAAATSRISGCSSRARAQESDTAARTTQFGSDLRLRFNAAGHSRMKRSRCPQRHRPAEGRSRSSAAAAVPPISRLRGPTSRNAGPKAPADLNVLAARSPERAPLTRFALRARLTARRYRNTGLACVRRCGPRRHRPQLRSQIAATIFARTRRARRPCAAPNGDMRRQPPPGVPRRAQEHRRQRWARTVTGESSRLHPYNRLRHPHTRDGRGPPPVARSRRARSTRIGPRNWRERRPGASKHRARSLSAQFAQQIAHPLRISVSPRAPSSPATHTPAMTPTSAAPLTGAESDARRATRSRRSTRGPSPCDADTSRTLDRRGGPDLLQERLVAGAFAGCAQTDDAPVLVVVNGVGCDQRGGRRASVNATPSRARSGKPRPSGCVTGGCACPGASSRAAEGNRPEGGAESLCDAIGAGRRGRRPRERGRSTASAFSIGPMGLRRGLTRAEPRTLRAAGSSAHN